MCKYKTICVSNRHLCTGNFLERIRQLTQSELQAIILREKDLDEESYEQLAKQVLNAINLEDSQKRVLKPQLILHSYPEAAKRLQVHNLHMPLSLLQAYVVQFPNKRFLEWFTTLGVSVHSIEEAKEAQRLGATYLTAGHIFATGCKKGLPPKGLDFLEEVCAAVEIPVYAIGGIHPQNIRECLLKGAAGVCMMSEFMQ